MKVINLDDHTHYYRNVDFGPRLHDDMASNYTAGRHAFEMQINLMMDTASGTSTGGN